MLFCPSLKESFELPSTGKLHDLCILSGICKNRSKESDDVGFKKICLVQNQTDAIIIAIVIT